MRFRDLNYWGEKIWELGICWISTKRGGHLIILCKELPLNGILVIRQGKRIGELQSQGKYVAGLGSVHLSGLRYNWERNKGYKWWWKFESVKEMTDHLTTNLLSKNNIINNTMKEIIIIETYQGKKIKSLLEQEHLPYKVYQESEKKTDIFANYGKAIKDQERQKELKLWDNADLDEELNKDGEWWK